MEINKEDGLEKPEIPEKRPEDTNHRNTADAGLDEDTLDKVSGGEDARRTEDEFVRRRGCRTY